MKKNLYEVLGVEKTANTEEIKKAYKKLARLYHPDMHANASAEEKEIYEAMFKEVNNAHDILSNPKKKAEYDCELAYQAARKAYTSQNSSYNRESRQHNYNQNTEEYSASQEEENFNPVDILEEMIYETKEKYKKAWKEIRKEEKRYSLNKRHSRLNKEIHNDYYPKDDQIIDKVGYGLFSGILHIGLEAAYQLSKLKYIKEDSFPKFVIRNRNLLATVLTTTIVLTSAGSQLAENIEEPTQPSISQCETIDDEISPMITIYRKYEIQYGDTLTALAEDANTTAYEIAKQNGISVNALIREGQTITIPYYYKEEDLRFFTESIPCDEDDSLSKIAAEYDTKQETIRELNGDAIDEYGDILSSSILVPNFISKKVLAVRKDAENYTYQKEQ